MIKIWIDADAAPNAVKDVVFRAAQRLQIETFLVANSLVSAPKSSTTVRSIVVREGADQADRYIVQHASCGDIAITADIPLAALLVEKSVITIDPRGDQYNSANIASRLSMRNFMDEMRGAGMETGGNAPFTARDKKAFASTFDRMLTKAMRSNDPPPVQ